MKSSTTVADWTKGIITHSGEETEEIAKNFAALLPADQTLVLEGDLGAGKTTFVRGLAKGFGIQDDVTSPSFSLLNIYRGKRMLFHVDAYRLTKPESFDDLMIWDTVVSPWNVIIEWPERVASRLPRFTLEIKSHRPFKRWPSIRFNYFKLKLISQNAYVRFR
jgi:tRNA threonylcarbamoyladenosine biosynthesis protein TsaE